MSAAFTELFRYQGNVSADALDEAALPVAIPALPARSLVYLFIQYTGFDWPGVDWYGATGAGPQAAQTDPSRGAGIGVWVGGGQVGTTLTVRVRNQAALVTVLAIGSTGFQPPQQQPLVGVRDAPGPRVVISGGLADPAFFTGADVLEAVGFAAVGSPTPLPDGGWIGLPTQSTADHSLFVEWRGITVDGSTVRDPGATFGPGDVVSSVGYGVSQGGAPPAPPPVPVIVSGVRRRQRGDGLFSAAPRARMVPTTARSIRRGPGAAN